MLSSFTTKFVFEPGLLGSGLIVYFSGIVNTPILGVYLVMPRSKQKVIRSWSKLVALGHGVKFHSYTNHTRRYSAWSTRPVLAWYCSNELIHVVSSVAASPFPIFVYQLLAPQDALDLVSVNTPDWFHFDINPQYLTDTAIYPDKLVIIKPPMLYW